MKVCVRAHDMGMKGSEAIARRAGELGIDGLQMVVYKNYADVPYAPGGITPEKAAEIGKAMASAGLEIPLIGAYFNPVHSDRAKAQRCFDIFADYLKCAKAMGGQYVGSETGSRNDEPWIYHPLNRTEESYGVVVDTFQRLADIAAGYGVSVALEGAAHHVCWTPEVLRDVIKRIDRPNVKVIFDIYNYIEASNQHDYLDILDRGLKIFAGDIILFHIKDWVYVDENTCPKQVAFGRGEADREAILARIKAYDPDAVLVLEGTAGNDIPYAVSTIREIWDRV